MCVRGANLPAFRDPIHLLSISHPRGPLGTTVPTGTCETGWDGVAVSGGWSRHAEDFCRVLPCPGPLGLRLDAARLRAGARVRPPRAARVPASVRRPVPRGASAFACRLALRRPARRGPRRIRRMRARHSLAQIRRRGRRDRCVG